MWPAGDLSMLAMAAWNGISQNSLNTDAMQLTLMKPPSGFALR
jgi:hypothetical protein